MRDGFLIDVETIGDKYQIEFPRLCRLRLLLVELKIHAGIYRNLGMPPYGHIAAHPMNQCAKFDLLAICHAKILLCGLPVKKQAAQAEPSAGLLITLLYTISAYSASSSPVF
jgi:hypothetical protein